MYLAGMRFLRLFEHGPIPTDDAALASWVKQSYRWLELFKRTGTSIEDFIARHRNELATDLNKATVRSQKLDAFLAKHPVANRMWSML